MKLIFMKPKKAALCLLNGVFQPTENYTWIGPRVFNVWGLPKLKRLKTCKIEERQKIGQIAQDIYRKLKLQL